MNNSQIHYYKKKTQVLLATMNRRSQFALTCKEHNKYNKKTRILIHEFTNMICNTNLQAKKQ